MRKFSITLLALISTIVMLLWSFFNYGYIPLMLHAEDYDSSINYSDYWVDNFNEYKTVITKDTPGVRYYLKVSVTFQYSTVNFCPSGLAMAENVYIYSEMYNDNGFIEGNASGTGPSLYCSQNLTYYTYTHTLDFTEFVDVNNSILEDDNEAIRFYSELVIAFNPFMYGTQFRIQNYHMRQWVEYDFNNTYLMSTFLLDSAFNYSNMSDYTTYPFVLYAETLNDRYTVYNDELFNETTRRKYAIPIPDITAAIAVNKIGVGYTLRKQAAFTIYPTSSSATVLNMNQRIFLLNAAPMRTPYDNVSIDTDPNYSICDYVLGFPVDCTLNGESVGSIQAMANDVWEWLIKESPIFSDIYTVAVGGFQWLGNALQFLGSFSPESILGGMIFLSAGVLLIVWGFKGE